MQFEAKLPAGIAIWALRQASLDTKALGQLSFDYFHKNKVSFPATVQSRYVRSGKSIPVVMTAFGFGLPERIDRWMDENGKIVIKRGASLKIPTHLRIEIADENAGAEIKKLLNYYSFENDGEGVFWRDHCALYERIDEALKPEGLSMAELQRGAVLTRPAIEALMRLGEKVERYQWRDIHHLFGANRIPKKDRAIIAPWLVKRFESGLENDDQLGVRIWDNAAPEIAEDLIRLIEDRRYEHHRGPLCRALAETKHPRAADVIASVMDEKWMEQWCLGALGKTRGAEKHIPKIQKLLSHPVSDVRRDAKKLLKKLGVAAEIPPAPVHLVKGKRHVPEGLEEWSTNLDMDDLAPTLEKLALCIEEGFARTEIAEVMAVAEEMEPDQTKTFRFPIKTGGVVSELWIVAFMDDGSSPDLYIHAEGKVVQKFDLIAQSPKE
jgi:hypothetical protein